MKEMRKEVQKQSIFFQVEVKKPIQKQKNLSLKFRRRASLHDHMFKL